MGTGALLTATGVGFLFLALAADAAAEEAHSLRLELREDRLSLDARAVPLERVLAAFVDRMGIAVHGRPAESRAVHTSFEAVPVAEALQRLLDRESFTLTYAADGTLRSIALHGRVREPPNEPGSGAAPAVAAPQPPQPVAPAGTDRAEGAVRAAQPASGSFLDRVSPEQQVAIRAAASHTMLGAMMQDEAFLERLRANTGEDAEGFLARLTTTAPSEEVRTGAAAALEDLRRQHAGEPAVLAPESPSASMPTAGDGRDRRRRRRGAPKRTEAQPPAIPGR